MKREQIYYKSGDQILAAEIVKTDDGKPVVMPVIDKAAIVSAAEYEAHRAAREKASTSAEAAKAAAAAAEKSFEDRVAATLAKLGLIKG